MATPHSAIGSVKWKLDSPQYPSEVIIGEAYVEVLDEKVTEANLSRHPWFLQKVVIDVQAGQAEYQLDNLAFNFDKPRYLYTLDESNPNHNRGPVEIVTHEQLIMWHGGGDPASIAQVPGGVVGISHSAIAATVYYDAGLGSNVLEFAPIPNGAARYVLVYEVGTQRPQSVQAAGFRFAQFDGYVANTTALRVLPLCKWRDLTDEQNRAKRADLAGGQGYGLVADVARGDLLYWKWRHSGQNPSGQRAIGWAENRR